MPQYEKGGDNSTTYATLSEGRLNIGGKETTTQELGINSDSSNAHRAVAALPDLAKITEKQQIVAKATSDIVSATHTFSSNRQKTAAENKAKAEAEFEGRLKAQNDGSYEAYTKLDESERRNILINYSETYRKADAEAQNWGVGGKHSRALNAGTTLATGLLGGQSGLQSAVNAAAPYASEAIGRTFGHGENKNETAQAIGHFLLGATIARVNGGNFAAGGSAAVAAEKAAEHLAQRYNDGKTAIDPQTGEFNANLLPEHIKEEIKSKSGVIASLTGAAIGGTLSDAQTGGVIGQNAVVNNSILQLRGESYLDRLKKVKGNKKALNILYQDAGVESTKNRIAFEQQCYASIAACEINIRKIEEARNYYSFMRTKHPEWTHTEEGKLLSSLQYWSELDLKMAKEILSYKKKQETMTKKNPEPTTRYSEAYVDGRKVKRVWNDGWFAANLEKTPPIRSDYYAVQASAGTIYIPARDKSNIMIGIPYTERTDTDSNKTHFYIIDSDLYKEMTKGIYSYGKGLINNKKLELPKLSAMNQGASNYIKSAAITNGYIIAPSDKTKDKLDKAYKTKKEELIKQGVYNPNPKLHYTEEIDNIWKEETNNFLPGESTTVSFGQFGGLMKIIRTTQGDWAIELGAGTPGVSASHGTTYQLRKEKGTNDSK